MNFVKCFCFDGKTCPIVRAYTDDKSKLGDVSFIKKKYPKNKLMW
jgi:hypothetical protein